MKIDCGLLFSINEGLKNKLDSVFQISELINIYTRWSIKQDNNYSDAEYIKKL